MNRRCAGIALLAVVIVSVGVPRPGRAADPAETPSANPVPVVAACANPKLPSDILAGPVPATAVKPLAEIDATDRARRLDLKLAVAANDSDRDLGLMCVTALRSQHGMIFVFNASQHWEFWMKNTLVPLDMVWLSANGTITTIAANVPASTRETADDEVARRDGVGRYVVELADGEAKIDGLSVGERLSLPPLHVSQ